MIPRGGQLHWTPGRAPRSPAWRLHRQRAPPHRPPGKRLGKEWYVRVRGHARSPPRTAAAVANDLARSLICSVAGSSLAACDRRVRFTARSPAPARCATRPRRSTRWRRRSCRRAAPRSAFSTSAASRRTWPRPVARRWAPTTTPPALPGPRLLIKTIVGVARLCPGGSGWHHGATGARDTRRARALVVRASWAWVAVGCRQPGRHRGRLSDCPPRTGRGVRAAVRT